MKIITIDDGKAVIYSLEAIKFSTSDNNLINKIDNYLDYIQGTNIDASKLQIALDEISKLLKDYRLENKICRLALKSSFPDLGELFEYDAVDWVDLGQKVIEQDELVNKKGEYIFLASKEIKAGISPATAFSNWKTTIENELLLTK